VTTTDFLLLLDCAHRLGKGSLDASDRQAPFDIVLSERIDGAHVVKNRL